MKILGQVLGLTLQIAEKETSNVHNFWTEQGIKLKFFSAWSLGLTEVCCHVVATFWRLFHANLAMFRWPKLNFCQIFSKIVNFFFIFSSVWAWPMIKVWKTWVVATFWRLFHANMAIFRRPKFKFSQILSNFFKNFQLFLHFSISLSVTNVQSMKNLSLSEK